METERSKAMADGVFIAILVIRGMEGDNSVHEEEIVKCFGRQAVRRAEARHVADLARCEP